MKKTILILIFIISNIFAFSQEIDNFYAEEIASKYLYSKFLKSDTTNYKIKNTELISYNGHPSYYVVNFKPEGFVILSAYKFYEPILGYSTENNFQTYNMPDNLYYWMQQYSYVIDSIYIHNPTNKQYSEKWNYYENLNYQKRETKAGFFLLSSEWGQSINNDGFCGHNDYGAYNKFVPENNSACNCDKCTAGCIAVAMAQIINYWQYPLYSSKRIYDWQNMAPALYNTSTFAEIDAVAHLIADCGTFLNMNYCHTSSCASSTLFSKVRKSYIDDFKYSSDAVLHRRVYYSNWENLLRENLDNGFPVLYTGYRNVHGHAFVCDGYDYDDINLFHFNFGSNGHCKMYFYLTNLNTYNKRQKAIFNIYPETYYGCSSEIYLGQWYSENANLQPMLDQPLAGTIYSANNSYPENYRTVYNGDDISMHAYNSIVLRQGFSVRSGGKFHADIMDCHQQKSVNRQKNIQTDEETIYRASILEFNIYPNPVVKTVQISYNLPQETDVLVKIYDVYGKIVKKIEQTHKQTGMFQYYIDLSSLENGVYFCSLKTSQGVVSKKIIKM